MKLINQLTLLIEEETTPLTPTSSSEKLIDFLTSDEGAGGEPVLYTYDDGYYNDPPKKYDSSRYKSGKPKGTLTIGYGHTGKHAFEGNVITEPEALKYLKEDLKIFENGVNVILKDWSSKNLSGAKLNQCQYDALVSLMFNGGRQRVRNSDWIQDIKYGKFDTAEEKIKSWNCPYGICNRRIKESNLFANCEY